MSTKLTAVALTAEEKAKLESFVTKCVMNNASFPPSRVSNARMHVQELLHNRSLSELNNYGAMIFNQNKKSDWNALAAGTEDKSVYGTGHTATEICEAIALMMKNKTYMEAKEKAWARKAELMEKLEDLKTPSERKAELEAELALLNA